MNSPSADASALSLVAPLPLVKHIGECASRMCSDHTLGTRLRQEAISILMPRPGQHARHVGDGLLQRQILAGDAGARLGESGVQRQQGLRIGVEVFHLLDDELRPGLHHLLHRAAVDGTQDALAVLVGNIRRQLDLDLEDLLGSGFPDRRCCSATGGCCRWGCCGCRSTA
jgi:hypothetical protein